MILIFLVLFILLPCSAAAQTAAPADKILQVKKLYDAGRWNDVVQAVPESPAEPADLELYRGLALANLQRWDEARKAFEAGLASHPRDSRFFVELAGIAYHQKKYAPATRYLRRALAIDPHDDYANNFIASIYFLEDNLEAALKHWNRVGKPRLASLTYAPQPSLDPLILDRAFRFSRGGVWGRDQYLTTKTRLDALDVFPRTRFDLAGQPDGSFDLTFRAAERNGWGSNKWQGSFSLLRGLPFETVYPQFYNLGHSGFNWLSLLRWDDQKRRLASELDAPLFENPAVRVRLYFDARDENWNVSSTIVPSAPSPARLNLEKAVAGAEIRFIESGRWQWSGGVEYSDREFRSLSGIPAPTASFFTSGSALELRSGVQRFLIRFPERRFTLLAGASGALGAFFANPLGRYGRLQSSLAANWFPQAQGEDYQMQTRLRGGVTFGKVPFDDLFMLGFDRDTDLWLHGHPALNDGQKGGAPLGRNFVLVNWELDKIVYENPFFTVKLGPLLDTGNVYDPSGFFGSPRWLWNTGLQTKIRVLDSAEIILGYGKDLRSGRNSFFATFSR
ncbi:MAG TPA: tetratricopeptide repeat protein [Candidatus Acidoferrales bacterium]|nr:tetratricopeptide repeat protein [Candidatus Acidoferrales bacterium]